MYVYIIYVHTHTPLRCPTMECKKSTGQQVLEIFLGLPKTLRYFEQLSNRQQYEHYNVIKLYEVNVYYNVIADFQLTGLFTFFLSKVTIIYRNLLIIWQLCFVGTLSLCLRPCGKCRSPKNLPATYLLYMQRMQRAKKEGVHCKHQY